MCKALFATLFLFVFSILSSAQQQQAQPAPPQSPRQALIEVINGGQNAVMKHLTMEVQQLLSQPENKKALMFLSMTSSVKSQMGPDVQTFESGPVLLSMNDAREHRKIEVQVDNDDLSGDQDSLELSLHSFHDGVEQQDEEWQAFLSHFTVTLVRQQNVWRLSKVGVDVELAIGDPEFLKKTYLRSVDGDGGMVGGTVGLDAHTSSGSGNTEQSHELTGGQLVMYLGISEQTYARQNAEIGFTCTLADLARSPIFSNNSAQVGSGIYNGYKISLTGCQGKPAGSFQITVEPVPGKGGKAYCTDATHNIRVSDDGRGSTCVIAGKVVTQEKISSTGFYLASPTTTIKPKD